jgi:hypothetical protein
VPLVHQLLQLPLLRSLVLGILPGEGSRSSPLALASVQGQTMRMGRLQAVRSACALDLPQASKANWICGRASI